MIVSLELTPETFDILAEAIAKRLAAQNSYESPLTVPEFAKATKRSTASIYHHLSAGNIARVPGIHKKLIPASELKKYQ